MTKVPMTEQGAEQLRKEVEHLKSVARRKFGFLLEKGESIT